MTRPLDFESLERPRTPNTYLVAPEGLCRAAVPDEDSPVFAVPQDEMFRRVREAVAAAPRWREVFADASTGALQFVAVSALFRFRDDVDVLVVPGPDGQGAQIAVYSRSRVGYSDLGANRKRVRALMAELES